MGSVASFLAQFTEGLTGGLKEHHKEQKRLELKEQDDQLQTLQMAAQHAAQTNDTRAYGMILQKIGEFTNSGAGKKGKQQKDNIISQFGQMLSQGVEEVEPPQLPESRFQPEMSFNPQGQPSLTPKPLEQLSNITPHDDYRLVRKPLFEPLEQRQERELKLYERKRTLESDLIEQRDAAKAKTKLQEIRLRIQGSKDIAGLRNQAAVEKEINALATAEARRYGRSRPNDADLQIAGDIIIGTAVANEDKARETVNKLKQDIKDAPEKLRLMKERVANAYAIGTERNRILAGQLNLGQARFNYEVTNKKAIDSLENEYNKINSQLMNIEDHIMSATKDGNDALRSENIKEAERLKTRKGQIEAELEQRLADTAGQAIPQGQGYTPQAGAQTVTPPQIVTIGQNKFIIGKEYIVKGKRIVVDMVNGQPQVREVQ